MCGRTLPGLTSEPCPRADLQLPSLDGVGAPGAPALASGRPSGLWPPHACEALGPGFFPESKGMGEVSTAPNPDDGEERSCLRDELWDGQKVCGPSCPSQKPPRAGDQFTREVSMFQCKSRGLRGQDAAGFSTGAGCSGPGRPPPDRRPGTLCTSFVEGRWEGHSPHRAWASCYPLLLG